MGVNRLFSDTELSNFTPNPNPFRYKIIEKVENKDYVLLYIEYPDAVTFNGIKVLLYTVKDYKQLEGYINDIGIDPHFLEDVITPVARFKPTTEGILLAIKTFNNRN